jgi:hypothetical protein
MRREFRPAKSQNQSVDTLPRRPARFAGGTEDHQSETPRNKQVMTVDQIRPVPRTACPPALDATALVHKAYLRLVGDQDVEEAGAALGLSRAVAYRNWKYARAWLREALEK